MLNTSEIVGMMRRERKKKNKNNNKLYKKKVDLNVYFGNKKCDIKPKAKNK